MIDGQQIRDARERAGLTQQQLGERVGVGMRTVGNWERGETVPRNREAAIRAVLADHLDAPGQSPLAAVSDVELIAELARRLGAARTREAVVGNAQHPAPIATPDPGAPTRDQLRWDQHAAALQAGPGRRLTDREVVATLGPRPLVDPEPGAEANPGRRRRRQGA